MRRTTAALLVTVALSGCASGPQRIRVILTSGQTRLVFRAEVATDPAARGQGLMFRKTVPAGTGMYFAFPKLVQTGFYMKNTLVPLDIAWIRAGRLVEIAHMQPCPGDPCPVWTPKVQYDAALETAVGALHGLDVGAQVEVFGTLPDPS